MFSCSFFRIGFLIGFAQGIMNNSTPAFQFFIVVVFARLYGFIVFVTLIFIACQGKSRRKLARNGRTRFSDPVPMLGAPR